jgi:hypothetical protein
VRPGRVVVPQVLGQHPAQVMLIDDQQPVEDLPAQSADHPFADRVPSGRLRRAEQDPDALRGEHGIEGTDELARAVPDQELDTSHAPAHFHQEVTRRLRRPGAVRIGGDAGQVSPAGAVLDHDQRVETPHQHGVHVDEVGRDDAAGLRGQELSPSRPLTAGRGADPRVMQDLPDRGGRDRVAEPDQFALHPAVPHVGFSVAMRITSLRTAAAVDSRPGPRRLA